MPATPRGERTKAAIRDAARTVFAERGYFNAKIADISAAANKSPGSFYNYYENKEALLEDMAEEFTATILSQTTQVKSKDPYLNIRETVSVYWANYRDNVATMIGLFELSMRDPRFEERWHLTRQRGLDNMLRGIRKASREGHLKGVNHEALASALMSMMEFFCWTWLARGGEPGLQPIDETVAIDTLAQVWFRALHCEPNAD